MLEASIDGSHPIVQRLMRLAERLGTTNVPVHIVGEQGSGRETLARVIHAQGGAPRERFVAVDCRDAPAHTTLARLLFHGTGACGSRPTTLFLREPGALDAEFQRELATAMRVANGMRVVASHVSHPEHTAPAASMEAALCDVFARVQLFVPPLRERRCVVRAFVERLVEGGLWGVGVGCRLWTDALVHLWEHDWPGNVGELKQTIESLARASTRGLIEASDLPAAIRGTSTAPGRQSAIGKHRVGYRCAS
jgi:DNA-binding NtrC family response regulator